jgi:hypothetical protein
VRIKTLIPESKETIIFLSVFDAVFNLISEKKIDELKVTDSSILPKMGNFGFTKISPMSWDLLLLILNNKICY